MKRMAIAAPELVLFCVCCVANDLVIMWLSGSLFSPPCVAQNVKISFSSA